LTRTEKENEMKVTYVKVSESDVAVIDLAKQLNVTPKSVAASINNDRYRKAYNKVKQVRDKQMREFFKANPTMLPKEGK